MEPSGGPSIDAHGSVVAFSSRHPTDASDKRNDFDLYVATVADRAVFTATTRTHLSASAARQLFSIPFSLFGLRYAIAV